MFPLTNEIISLLSIPPKCPLSMPVERFEMSFEQMKLGDVKRTKLLHIRNHLCENNITKLMADDYYEAYVATVIDNAHLFVVPLAYIKIMGHEVNGSYFRDSTPSIHHFLASILMDFMKNKDEFYELSISTDEQYLKLVKSRQLFCAKFKANKRHYYARVRIVDTVKSVNSQVIGLIVFDIDMGTITTIPPRSLYYLPDCLARIEPFGLVVKPNYLAYKNRPTNDKRHKLQSMMAAIFERAHPKIRIKTTLRQERKSEAIKGPYNEVDIEMKIESNEMDLIKLLTVVHSDEFTREIDNLKIMEQISLLDIDPSCPDQVFSQGVHVRDPMKLFEFISQSNRRMITCDFAAGITAIEETSMHCLTVNTHSKLDEKIADLIEHFKITPLTVALAQCANNFYYETDEKASLLELPDDLPIYMVRFFSLILFVNSI